MDTDQQLWGLVANPFDSAATPILVLSLFGLLLCPFLGPVAVYRATRLRNSARSAGWPEPGLGKVAHILGYIGSFWTVLMLALVTMVVVEAVV